VRFSGPALAPLLHTEPEMGLQHWEPRPLDVGQYELSEGPLWAHGQVHWVDVHAGDVHSATPNADVTTLNSHTRRNVGDVVSAVVSASDGTCLVATRTELQVIGPFGMQRTGVSLSARPEQRFNDGACDPHGHFVVGTLTEQPVRPNPLRRESLFLWRAGDEPVVIDNDLTLSNGIGWSPDGATMYNVDTLAGTIWARPWGKEGPKGTRRPLRHMAGCLPDGLAVDATGALWVAMWGSSSVLRLSPHGDLLGVIETKAPYVSSVAFVGESFDRLLITTARCELNDLERRTDTLSGSLFVADVGVKGLPTTPWSGLPTGTNPSTEPATSTRGT